MKHQCAWKWNGWADLSFSSAGFMKCVWKAPATASLTVIRALKSLAIFSTAWHDTQDPFQISFQQLLCGRGLLRSCHDDLLDRIGVWHHLAARQTSADCIVSVAEEVGYPDALFRAHFLVGCLAQLVDLHA